MYSLPELIPSRERPIMPESASCLTQRRVHPLRQQAIQRQGIEELLELAESLHARRREIWEIAIALCKRADLLEAVKGFAPVDLLDILRSLPGYETVTLAEIVARRDAEWKRHHLALAAWLTTNAGSPTAEALCELIVRHLEAKNDF